jgi:hypothetical protein
VPTNEPGDTAFEIQTKALFDGGTLFVLQEAEPVHEFAPFGIEHVVMFVN